MHCRYSLMLYAVCPVDQSRDSYSVTVESPREIRVEKIIELATAWQTVEATQEEITAKLAEQLGASVTTRGYHSGVLTIVSAP